MEMPILDSKFSHFIGNAPSIQYTKYNHLLYLNLLSLTIKADPEDKGTGVQVSATEDLKSKFLRSVQPSPGSLTHKMGYSVAYNVEQSISMVPPCLVLIEALMYEMVGVLCPWTKKAKLDHKKAKFKYFIMIGTWLWQQ